MFITYALNIDYLSSDLRLRIGDIEKTRFSDSVIRSALVGGIKMLQRRWNNRYLIYSSSLKVSPLPEGVVYDADIQSGVVYDTIIPSGSIYAYTPNGYDIIPSGLTESDIFRNPGHTFVDNNPNRVISQEDDHIIVLAGSIILQKSFLSSNVSSFQSWSDGEYSFSNLSVGSIMGNSLDNEMKELDSYFRRRLKSAQVVAFH